MYRGGAVTNVVATVEKELWPKWDPPCPQCGGSEQKSCAPPVCSRCGYHWPGRAFEAPKDVAEDQWSQRINTEALVSRLRAETKSMGPNTITRWTAADVVALLEALEETRLTRLAEQKATEALKDLASQLYANGVHGGPCILFWCTDSSAFDGA
jgi:hypothetical protein